ncbi:MAG: hypothetical protein ABIF40_03745 [archaeon]
MHQALFIGKRKDLVEVMEKIGLDVNNKGAQDFHGQNITIECHLRRKMPACSRQNYGYELSFYNTDGVWGFLQAAVFEVTTFGNEDLDKYQVTFRYIPK